MLVIQHSSHLHPGDAVGNCVRVWCRRIGEMGHDSLVCLPAGGEGAVHLRKAARISTKETFHMLHYGAFAYPLHEFFSLPGRKILVYHNITPARFFTETDDILFSQLRARRELAAMASRTDLALGVSRFNERELSALGFAHRGVLPLGIDFSRLEQKRAPGPGPMVGVVGRIAPNKNLEEALGVLYFLRRRSSGARMVFLGSGRPIGGGWIG